MLGKNGAVHARLMLLIVLVVAGCGEADTTPASTEGCADVIDVVVRGDGSSFSFDVAVRSADKGWEKYADAWEVRGPDGTVLGVRELLHPHETEQPFTRSLSGVDVPDGITHVRVAARDSVLGFCGRTYQAALPEGE